MQKERKSLDSLFNEFQHRKNNIALFTVNEGIFFLKAGIQNINGSMKCISFTSEKGIQIQANELQKLSKPKKEVVSMNTMNGSRQLDNNNAYDALRKIISGKNIRVMQTSIELFGFDYEYLPDGNYLICFN